MRQVTRIILLVFAFAASAFAQDANLTGLVKDPSEAAVPKASVTIVNQDTGVVRSTSTNDQGYYYLPALLPGRYKVSVQAAGFETMVRDNVKLDVAQNARIDFALKVGPASVTVIVAGGAPLINTESGAVSTVIDRNFAESLPLNGRSFNMLLQLTPGVVIAPVTGSSSSGQFSISGQRTDANNFLVDGVSANFGISPSLGISSTGTGGAQAFSALGGTSSLVSVEALQEFRVETSTYAPEFGRNPGGQVILNTRSGTNNFHGGVYEYFRNDVMDANDWFANQRGVPRAPERHNDFGGFLGGPIRKDKTFFFLSYEAARLRTPRTLVFQVPSQDARTNAPAALAPFLNAFPKPNGPVSACDFKAQFTGSFSNSATLNATSIRVDHAFNRRLAIFGRYNDAPSRTASHSGIGSELDTVTANTRTLTVGLTMLLSDTVSNTFRGNYSTQRSTLSLALDSFGGAVPLDRRLLIGSLAAADTAAAFEPFDTVFYFTGPDARNRTRQLNFVDDLGLTVGTHQLKFGGDYRVIFLDANPPLEFLSFSANTVQAFVSTGTASLSISTAVPARILAQSLSLYGQDTWKITPRLTLTYGLRWELAPAPSARGETTLGSWTNVNNPATLTLAPAGTPLWKTTYANFAPRIGLAYALTETADFVLRAGWGMFYDLGVGSSADLTSTFPNSAFGFFPSVSLPVGDITLPVISRQPPFVFPEGFSPSLSLPRSYQWNVALEKSFGGKQTISASYVGQAGRDLLRQEALFQPNPNFVGDFLLTQNDARSNYDALQLQYRRPLAARLQALVNYTWSHSLDNSSNDVVAGLSNTIISAAKDYASSDFDVRHSFSGALTYDIPAAAKSGPISFLTRGWSVDTVIVARTGFPFNGKTIFTSPDPGGTAQSRPDLVPGQPFWIPNATAGGGQSLNPAAFSIPSTVRQGTEGRNDIPGFRLAQVDLSLGRRFSFTERVKLQFRADAFNLFNHPNFTNPPAFVEFGPAELQSIQMLNVGLQGLNPLFQEGGPRSLQLSLKLAF